VNFSRNWTLTEGRSTGILKIIKAMAENGSPAPEFETDEERSYLIRLPVHEKAALVEDAAGDSRQTIQTIVELLRERPTLGRNLPNSLATSPKTA